MSEKDFYCKCDHCRKKHEYSECSQDCCKSEVENIQLQYQLQLQQQKQEQFQEQIQAQAQFQAQIQAQAQMQAQIQAQAQIQGQAQAQNDTDTISNIGNPVINVHVDCCDQKHPHVVKKSAFKAESNTAQFSPANTPLKVQFQNQLFDLANEYDSTTSTFTPTEDGIYLVTASVSFLTGPGNRDAFVGIRVNGVQVAAADNDFFGGGTNVNVVSVTTLLQLTAGIGVDVIAGSTLASITLPIGAITNFEAARLF